MPSRISHYIWSPCLFRLHFALTVSQIFLCDNLHYCGGWLTVQVFWRAFLMWDLSFCVMIRLRLWIWGWKNTEVKEDFDPIISSEISTWFMTTAVDFNHLTQVVFIQFVHYCKKSSCFILTLSFCLFGGKSLCTTLQK